MRPQKDVLQHASHPKSLIQNDAAERQPRPSSQLVRWQFKMDTEQVLKVSVTVVNVWSGWQIFYAKMGRDGRITIPKLQRELLRDKEKAL